MSVDILILTAIGIEFEAVLQVGSGAAPGSFWSQGETDKQGFKISQRAFVGRNGSLRILVAESGQGESNTIIRALPLIETYKPRCLAMSGVCGGNPSEVELGDILSASMVWQFDRGANVEVPLPGGHSKVSFLPETESERHQYADFEAHLRDYKISKEVLDILTITSPEEPKPFYPFQLPIQPQLDWLLYRLYEDNSDPRKHLERPSRCPDWAKVLGFARMLLLVDQDEISLTDDGKNRARRLSQNHPDGLPPYQPKKQPNYHFGPIGSSNQLQKNPFVWEQLKEIHRKTIGIEMESAAIAAVARSMKIPHWAVMKGVMDYADLLKNDGVKKTCARASAECLIDFLRQHIAPGGEDKILREGTRPLPPDPAPSQLLVPAHQIVPFYGRRDFLQRLEGWCLESPTKAVRLFHAPGGSGKTRFAIELAHQMRENHGWRAGFLYSSTSREDFKTYVIQGNQNALAIIDYAESRDYLRELLNDLAQFQGHSHKLCLLLLARHAEDWWDNLCHACDKDACGILEQHCAEKLPPLEVSVSHQTQFQDAFAAFAKVSPTNTPLPLTFIDDALYERPLYLHMAALAAAKKLPVQSAGTLMDTILDHEQDFWRTRFHSKPGGLTSVDEEDIWVKSIRLVTTALTLLGGVISEEKLLILIDKLLGIWIDNKDKRSMSSLMHRMYQKGDELYSGPLEPDLLGESMVIRTLSNKSSIPSKYLSNVIVDASQEQLQRSFCIVGGFCLIKQSSYGYSLIDETKKWLEEMLSEDPNKRVVPAMLASKQLGQKSAFINIGSVLEQILIRVGTIDDAVRLINAGLPESSVTLQKVTVWCWEQVEILYRIKLPTDEDKFLPDLAGSLMNLGNQYSNSGMREKAYKCSKESVEFYRKLSNKYNSNFLDELANALSNFGNHNSDIGKLEEVLKYTEESVEVHRILLLKKGDTFLPNFANILHNLANRYREMGNREQALQSAENAISIRRKLTLSNKAKFIPLLASSLSNVGAFYDDVNRTKEALDSAKEAVILYRNLVLENEDAFLPYLVTSLNNLGVFYGKNESIKNAIKHTKEALEICRNLVHKNEDAFLFEFSSSLNNLGFFYGKIKNHSEAIDLVNEAVLIRYGLVLKNEDAFLPHLALSLNNLGKLYGNIGMKEISLFCIQQSVDINRKLVIKNKAAFLPSLAEALHDLGNAHRELKNTREAIAFTREAVDIYYILSRNDYNTFQKFLAGSLNNLGLFYRDIAVKNRSLNYFSKSIENLKKSFEIYRKLLQNNHEMFLNDLDGNVGNLLLVYTDTNNQENLKKLFLDYIETVWPFFEKFLPRLKYKIYKIFEILTNIYNRNKQTPPLIFIYRKASLSLLLNQAIVSYLKFK